MQTLRTLIQRRGVQVAVRADHVRPATRVHVLPVAHAIHAALIVADAQATVVVLVALMVVAAVDVAAVVVQAVLVKVIVGWVA